MTKPSPKPTYIDPPVNEVAIAVQFAPLPTTMQLVTIATELANLTGFLNVSEQPPLGPMPTRRADEAQLQLQISNAPIGPRIWLQDEDEVHLIQLQHDRVALNWRRLDDSQGYPSFDSIRPTWDNVFSQVCDLAAGLNAPIVPNIFEVTYVNPVDPAPRARDLVAPWSGRYSDAFLPRPSSLRIGAEYDLPDDLGVLTIDMTPARRRDTDTDATLIRLIARGWPSTSDPSELANFLDVAHDWIVRGFTSFTTPKMHKAWGRET
ncbi:MAG TPA: TIGR04255 family protein [Acidimicrobiales bacterium]|nr:TIGR04255 family protein [Acidimicrobiales bacterium]